MFKLIFAALAASTVISASGALAATVTVPGATYRIQDDGYSSGSSDTPVSYSHHVTVGSGYSVTATTTAHASAEVNINVPALSSGTGAIGLFGPSAEVIYFFAVVGPADEMVPVHFTASGSATVTLGGATSDTDPNLRMDATATVAGQTMGICLNSISGGCPALPPFGTVTFEATADQVYEVDLYVSGQGQIACVGCSAVGTAYVDPFIQIDPDFADAADFQVLISAGIGNSPPTIPEPSTWVMMVVGLAGLGFANYRHRATTA